MRTTARLTRARPVALVVWAAATVAWVVWRGLPYERTQVLTIVVGGAVAASLGSPGRMARALRDWVPIAVILLAYDYTRGAADLVGRPVQVESVADLDRWLVGGAEVPTVWLQEHLTLESGPLAVFDSVVYASHFIVPFALAAYLWVRDRGLWLPWRRRFLTTTFLGLVTYLLLPVAPPWAASRIGVIGPVSRVAGEGWHELGVPIAESIITGNQATVNLFAAMPSLHMAYAVVTALTFASFASRRGRVLVALYPAAMGFVLVASGEHYIVDVLAGLALALGVHWAWARSAREAQPVPISEGTGGTLDPWSSAASTGSPRTSSPSSTG